MTPGGGRRRARAPDPALTPRATAAALATAALLVPALGLGEVAPATTADRWAFVEAWGVFRRDLDATVPGEHGGVYLVERAPELPTWLARDAVRAATAPRVIVLCSRRLAQGGDAKSIPALRSALERAPDEASRTALEGALLRLGDAALRRKVARRLRSASAPERWRAASTLAASGAEAAPALRAALEDPDGPTRLAAAAALASRGDRRAKALLARHIKSTNPFERVEAAHGLALAGDARGVPLLRKLLAEPGADRSRAARSLGLVGGAHDRRLLVEALRAVPAGRSRALRRAMTVAIGRITVRTSLPDLSRYLDGLDEPDDDDTGARGESLAAIGRAVAEGATERRAIAARLSADLESTLAGETPLARARRQELCRPAAELLAGRRPGVASSEAPPSLDRRRAVALLRKRGGDAPERIARFSAAVQLLDELGEALGHPARAEPPAVRVVGLGAERAVDGSLLTSWIAGPMAGPLRIELDSPRRLERLWVVAGCVESRASYRGHARVRELRVELDGGRQIVGRLADGDPYFQAVELGGVSARTISIEVAEVHPGRRHDAPACLPELRLE